MGYRISTATAVMFISASGGHLVRLFLVSLHGFIGYGVAHLWEGTRSPFPPVGEGAGGGNPRPPYSRDPSSDPVGVNLFKKKSGSLFF